MDRLRFIKDKYGEYHMPFQYYTMFGMITMPTEGKRVLIKNWSTKKSTVHPTHAHQNTCILTGKHSNITVIDVDFKDHGMDVINALFNKYGMPNTPIVLTPSGMHLYFSYNPSIPNMNRLIDNGTRIGIDIQNDGSIVIAPPSVVDGKRYRFKKGYSLEDVKISKMPTWLRKYIMDHIKESTLKRIQR